MIIQELMKLSEHIEKRDGEWVVTSKDRTKVLGTHPSRKKALKQLAAIEMSKAASVSEGEVLDVRTPTVEEIAKKHGVTPAVIQQQLDIGIEVEHEHTTSKIIAREIALDHLAEFPDYYDRLIKMEQ